MTGAANFLFRKEEMDLFIIKQKYHIGRGKVMDGIGIREFGKLINDKFQIVDLSPVIEKGIPRWPSHPHLVIDKTVTHEHDGFYCQSISMAEHTGAHVDAPAHSCSYKMDRTIDTFDVSHFFVPAVLYDLRWLELQPGEQATAEDILECERRSGAAVRENEMALLCFGWDRFWCTDKDAIWYAQNEPGLDRTAAELFYNRKVRAIGTDTIGGDIAKKEGECKKSWGHDEFWLPKDIIIFEELVNLSKLPVYSYFIALPLKIKDGSGSPLRAVAIVEK